MARVLALDSLCVDFPQSGEAVAAGCEEVFGVVGEHKVPHPELLGRTLELAVELEVCVAFMYSDGSVTATSTQEQ